MAKVVITRGVRIPELDKEVGNKFVRAFGKPGQTVEVKKETAKLLINMGKAVEPGTDEADQAIKDAKAAEAEKAKTGK